MTESAPGTSHHQRTRARRVALQALYQWQATGQATGEIETQFQQDQDLKGVDRPYFRELLHRIPAELARLDAGLSPCLDRPVAQVTPVERAILRIGAYELAFHPELPWRVVINEAVELAKGYGADQSHKFINGALDKLARELRAPEVGATAPPEARSR